MFSQRIRDVMEQESCSPLPPQTTVSQAAKLMAKRKVGAVIVIEDRHLVGIFTERDAVFASSRLTSICRPPGWPT